MAQFSGSVSNAECQSYISEFITFLNKSPSHFHATDNCRRLLSSFNFIELHERIQTWTLTPGGKYFFTRNGSSLVAFVLPANVTEMSIIAMGAHLDSPCLKLKPVTKMNDKDYLQINVQPYGSGIWHTWFDRDLTLAGRVFCRQNENDAIHTHLLHINRPIARIPTLAIHLTSGDERTAFSINLQNHLAPILGLKSKSNLDESSLCPHHHPAIIQTIATELGVDPSHVLDFELQLADVVPATVAGVDSEFIYSGRLDNLASCFQTLRALTDSPTHDDDDGLIKMVLLFDNEEVGSGSCQGADSTLLTTAMDRISSCFHNARINPSSSFLVSVDMAHGIHPNYRHKHDDHHAPVLGQGLVIKLNCNQRYSTSTPSSLLFQACIHHNHMQQQFAVRNDSQCGSTIGPILSTSSGIRSIDVGSPQLSMHSIREMMSVADAFDGYKQLKSVFDNYYQTEKKFDWN